MLDTRSNSCFLFCCINNTGKNLSLTKGNPTVQLVSSSIKQLTRMRKLENYAYLKLKSQNDKFWGGLFFSWTCKSITGFPRRQSYGYILLLYFHIFPALVLDIHILVTVWIPMARCITSDVKLITQCMASHTG